MSAIGCGIRGLRSVLAELPPQRVLARASPQAAPLVRFPSFATTNGETRIGAPRKIASGRCRRGTKLSLTIQWQDDQNLAAHRRAAKAIVRITSEWLRRPRSVRRQMRSR